MSDRSEFEKWILEEWGEPFHDFHGFQSGKQWSYSDHNLNAVWLGYCRGKSSRAQSGQSAYAVDDEGKGSLPWFVHAHNSGYAAGHHDTVEGGFTPIHHSDKDTYHEEVVMEILEDLNVVACHDTHPQPAQKGVPDWLYDGYAVYQNLTDEQKAQTSAKNVIDTLDAIVTMLKRPQPPKEDRSHE